MAELKNTTKSPAWAKLTNIHSLLIGADKLLDGIEIPDDSQGEFWAARELLKLAMDQVVNTYPSSPANEVTA